jgi:hypothetical protein
MGVNNSLPVEKGGWEGFYKTIFYLIKGATYNLRSPPLFLIVSFPCKRESRYYEQQIPAGVYPGENRGRNYQAG